MFVSTMSQHDTNTIPVQCWPALIQNWAVNRDARCRMTKIHVYTQYTDAMPAQCWASTWVKAGVIISLEKKGLDLL